MNKKKKKLSSNFSLISLDITDVGYKGEGIAKLITELNFEEKDYNFFVPFALPNEKIIAKPTQIFSKNVRAELVEIIKPSPERVNPQCEHFFKCGGCMLQHWRFEHYNNWKMNRVTSSIHQISSNTIIKKMVSSSQNSRRHAKFTAKRNKSKLIIGFYEHKSHFVTEITECLILEKSLIRLIQDLRKPLEEIIKIGDIIHIHANLLDNGIDLLIDGLADVSFKKFSELNKKLIENKVIRVHRRLNNKILDLIYITDRISLSNNVFSSVIYPPPGGFLQATVSGENTIIKCVMDALENYNKKTYICELFCGSGTITLPLLLQNFRINAFELNTESLHSIDLASKGKPFNNNIKTYTRNLKSKPLTVKELENYGAIIIDPPRSGAHTQFLNIAKSKVPLVISVSCDINTFVRDSKILIENNYNLKWVQPIDQFLYSPHIEVVGFFELNKAS